MSRFPKLSFFAWLFCSSHVLVGQNDTSRILPEVEIVAPSIRSAAIGGTHATFDTQQQQHNSSNNLAELIGRESGVFIKSYGMGSLATSSVRGGSASQTALVWNGFAIQSPMLGQLDLSLLPTLFLDEAALATGGGSAIWGSGAIGGVLMLKSGAALEQAGIAGHWQSTIGSYGWLGQQAKLRFKHKKLAATSRFFHQEATNDFAYQIGKLQKKQSNAAISQQGFMQNLHWQLTGKQSLEAHFWWQGSGREIPPTTTQNRSKAGQSDKILRTALEWKWLGNMAVVTAKTAFFEEEIDYQDSLSGVFEVTKFHSSIGEVEAQYQAGRHGSILLGINHSATKGFAAAYHGKQSQQQTAFFAGSRFAKGEWKAQLDARAELLDGRWLPTTPSLGLEWAPHPQLAIKGKLARNYRYPTLNDRYWQPGGNPELLPEQGWSEEISVLPILIYNEKWKLDYQFTAFNRTIKNWILWAVQPGEFYYSPGNITEVWSRGIEQRLHFSAPVASHVLKLNLGYDFVRSTSLKDVALPTIKAGEQLIYTPEHQAFGSIDYGLAQWHFSYQHRYTGQVATQTEALEDYHVGSFYLEKTIPFQPMTARVFIQIDNVWNANYRVVERRPMPGRNFRVGLRMDFEKLKSSTIF